MSKMEWKRGYTPTKEEDDKYRVLRTKTFILSRKCLHEFFKNQTKWDYDILSTELSSSYISNLFEQAVNIKLNPFGDARLAPWNRKVLMGKMPSSFMDTYFNRCVKGPTIRGKVVHTSTLENTWDPEKDALYVISN